MLTTKWWRSKTFWLNAVAMAIMLIQAIQAEAWIDPQYQVLILAILNTAMRMLTSKPISGTPAAKLKK